MFACNISSVQQSLDYDQNSCACISENNDFFQGGSGNIRNFMQGFDFDVFQISGDGGSSILSRLFSLSIVVVLMSFLEYLLGILDAQPDGGVVVVDEFANGIDINDLVDDIDAVEIGIGIVAGDIFINDMGIDIEGMLRDNRGVVNDRSRG